MSGRIDPEAKRQYDRDYYWANREKKLSYLADYKEAHREEINQKERERLLKSKGTRPKRIVHPGRERARAIINYGIKKGTISKQPCSICGTTRNVRGHHPDYYIPEVVVWLCQKHHMLEHKRNRRAPRRKDA
jgi:hypothetical protein